MAHWKTALSPSPQPLAIRESSAQTDASSVDPQYTPAFLEIPISGRAPLTRPPSTGPVMSESPIGAPGVPVHVSSALPITEQEAMPLDSAGWAAATVSSGDSTQNSGALGSQLNDGQLRFHTSGGALQPARSLTVSKPAMPSTPRIAPYIEYMKADHGAPSSRVRHLGYVWIGLCIFLGAVLFLP